MPDLRESFNQGTDSQCELLQDMWSWLFGYEQGGLIEEYLSGQKRIAWRRAKACTSWYPIQDGFVVKHTTMDIRGSINQRDLRLSQGRLDKQKPFMLSQDVELMYRVQKCVTSTISFYTFDRGSFHGADPFFAFQRVYSIQKVARATPDGKVRVAFRFFAVAREYREHKDIKCRACRIDDGASIANDERIKRPPQISSEQFPIGVIRIRLHDEPVWSAPLPGYESLLHDCDMGLGPPYSIPSFLEIVAHG